MVESIENLKKSIRANFRQLRNSITSEQATLAGKQLCNHLVAHPAYDRAENITCFLSFDGEIDTTPVVNQLIRDKKICYLPKLKPNKPNRLWFMPYSEDTPLKANKLNIQEVDLPVNHAIRVSELDLILMPLVAFDSTGNRLGMGGGFYDATLAHLKNAPRRPLCIGLAYEQQRVEKIPAEPWDFPLDGILTDKGFCSFQTKE
ncbi:5-formyltetrahydrofolate cyclo-ligase [Aliikangiella sp. IMCC44359]|uniref:5-formyltetrahydrofolate cyclo-ligase n=1 Tax=Aliikangiella sp. IMCC44359 TaxID=3459125 RepID=UPI00403B2952